MTLPILAVGGSWPLSNGDTMTQRPPTSGKAWSFIAGEKGVNRVRVYERAQLGLWIEYPENGKRKRRPLGHADRERAKRDARQMTRRIGRADERPAAVTLRYLTDLYLREVTPLKKSQGARSHDRRTIPLLLRAFGANRSPATLNRRDWDSFIARRRRGELHHGDRKGVQVRARIVEQDLKLLLAILNWAERSRDEVTGAYLLEKNPLRGLRLPREESPRRPTISVEQFKSLQLVAAEVSPVAELFVWLAWYTGHRGGAIRQLTWSDVDLEAGSIRWRAETDKIGHEHRTPLHPDIQALLRREQERVQGEGSAPLFPGERDVSVCMTRDEAADLWTVLARRAEIPQGERYGWHSFRRAFANQLRDVPLKELQTLGGWRSERTVVQVYLQPDEDAQRRALERLSR